MSKVADRIIDRLFSSKCELQSKNIGLFKEIMFKTSKDYSISDLEYVVHMMATHFGFNPDDIEIRIKAFKDTFILKFPLGVPESDFIEYMEKFRFSELIVDWK